MHGDSTAEAILPTLVHIFVLAFFAFVCLFAVHEPDVLRWALRSRRDIRDPKSGNGSILGSKIDPFPGSPEDGPGHVQQRALSRRKPHQQTTAQRLWRQQVKSGTSDAAASLSPGAGGFWLKTPPIPRRVPTRVHKEHYFVQSATLHSPRPSAEVHQLNQRKDHWRADVKMLKCAASDAALRRDLSAAGFSVLLEDTAPHLIRNVDDGQKGRATSATSTQSSNCCKTKKTICPPSILKTSCDATTLGLDACEVDAALCRDLITMVFLVPLAAAPPLADVQLVARHCRGKQRQGREASLMSDQGSSSCLLNAPTCPASSQMSREATGLGLDSCEEDSWSTYPEGSQDLPMDNSCMLRIANKFYKGRAMEAHFDKLSADTKLLGEAPDCFILPHYQSEPPRCFVQESQVILAKLPTAAMAGPGYFKALAKKIKARHASHATLPANSCPDGTYENNDKVRL